MSSGNKPLPESMLTHICVIISLCHIEWNHPILDKMATMQYSIFTEYNKHRENEKRFDWLIAKLMKLQCINNGSQGVICLVCKYTVFEKKLLSQFAYFLKLVCALVCTQDGNWPWRQKRVCLSYKINTMTVDGLAYKEPSHHQEEYWQSSNRIYCQISEWVSDLV